jgi:hypothetical protein
MIFRVDAKTRRYVAQRAGNVCEYCLIAEEDSFFRHQIEHIISLKHGGSSEPENLAFSCVFCNSNKGSDIGSIVESRGELVRFFNPRMDRWSEHFRLDGGMIVALTDIGTVTVRILKLNADERVMEREVLISRGLYPNENAVELIREH